MLAFLLLQDAPATVTVQVVLAILGGVALILALLGGGIDFQGKIVIPKMPLWSRILSFLAGAALIGIAIWLVILPSPPALSVPTTTTTPLPATPSETSSPMPTFTYTPTLTSAVTITPTLTDTPLPPPLAEIFPQVGGGEKFVYINYGGSLSDRYVTTDNCIHSGSYGLQLSYDMKGNGNGGWGVQWVNAPEKYFNASGLSTFTFWVKGAYGNETFQVSLKDTSGNETKVESNTMLVVSSEWMLATTPLSRFRGVNTTSIENVNFGFNKNYGAGSICIDDISFAP